MPPLPGKLQLAAIAYRTAEGICEHLDRVLASCAGVVKPFCPLYQHPRVYGHHVSRVAEAEPDQGPFPIFDRPVSEPTCS